MRRIARLAGVGPGDHVVEIGAGLGSLTLALAETGADVTAVEVDRGIVPRAARRRRRPARNVTVVEADAMRARLGRRCSAGSDRWTLVANLPYNVATPLVCDLLDDVPAIESMLVMVQREVGRAVRRRRRASKQYGAVSVKIAYWATARLVGHVPAVGVRAATQRRVGARRDRPPPSRPAVDRDRRCSRSCARRSGSAARCCAGRSPSCVTPEQFAAAGVSPEARPEQLDVDAWCRLTDAVVAASVDR